MIFFKAQNNDFFSFFTCKKISKSPMTSRGASKMLFYDIESGKKGFFTIPETPPLRNVTS